MVNGIPREIIVLLTLEIYVGIMAERRKRVSSKKESRELVYKFSSDVQLLLL